MHGVATHCPSYTYHTPENFEIYPKQYLASLSTVYVLIQENTCEMYLPKRIRFVGEADVVTLVILVT